MRLLGVVGLIGLGSACGYDEGLQITNMRGKVIIPRAAATRMMHSAAGGMEEVTDARLIGPVYLGLYPAVRSDILPFPHPEVGPAFQSSVAGDTYPYGGTTVGDFRFGCLPSLTCKVTSGRFVDWDDLLSWYTDRVQIPVKDASGAEVQNGEYIRQTCFDLLHVTSDDEVRVTARDKNKDGAITAADLDFQENADGDFEAEFVLWQQEYHQNAEGQGFSLWGWMDAPSEQYNYSTCDEAAGQRVTDYATDFYGGRQPQDLLNYPTVSMGDWTVSDGGWHVYQSPDDYPELRLDFEVTTP